MPRPRPPSAIDAVATPLFGLTWFGDPGDGTSIVAYCGGGGSAATGVNNMVVVRMATADGEGGGEGSGDAEDGFEISTGGQVGVSLTIIRNPFSGSLKLYVGLGSNVNCYSLPDGDLVDEISVGDNVNAIAVNSLADQLAVGCESGTVKLYTISRENEKMNSLPDYTCEGHSKAVCAVSFSPREDRLVSSAKDGTARVWHKDQELAVLQCDIRDPKAPPPRRTPQILVRGCAFGDLNGHLVYTIASGRRGKAYLSQWGLQENGQYQCLVRTECSVCPVSAMSLSGDAGLITLGTVDGSIILWGVERWRSLKKFPEVHDLPVTCIAARPYPVPLRIDADGVQMHAISASADSQLAWLTLQRSVPKRKTTGRSFGATFNMFVRLAFLAWMFYPLANDIMDKCEEEWERYDYMKTLECIRHDVLIAPDSRPGILVPPY